MRAGLLREWVQFYRVGKKANGFQKNDTAPTSILRTRCHRLKPISGDMGINAFEEFQKSVISLQVRKNKIITPDLTFLYQNSFYQIVNIDERPEDQTFIITGKKQNL